MNQDRLLALIEQLESAIARVKDAMQSAQLAVKRLMDELEIKRGDDKRNARRKQHSRA